MSSICCCLIGIHRRELIIISLTGNGIGCHQLFITTQIVLGIAERCQRLRKVSLCLPYSRLILTVINAIKRLICLNPLAALNVFFHHIAGYLGLNLYFVLANNLTGKLTGQRRILLNNLHSLDLRPLHLGLLLLIAAACHHKAGGNRKRQTYQQCFSLLVFGQKQFMNLLF